MSRSVNGAKIISRAPNITQLIIIYYYFLVLVRFFSAFCQPSSHINFLLHLDVQLSQFMLCVSAGCYVSSGAAVRPTGLSLPVLCPSLTHARHSHTHTTRTASKPERTGYHMWKKSVRSLRTRTMRKRRGYVFVCFHTKDLDLACQLSS